MKRVFNLILIIGIVFIFNACGEGKIDLSETEYEPKIVMDGYIYPHQQVREIKIFRNFPLSTNIDLSTVVLTEADVNIISVEDGKVHRLVFNPMSLGFEYQGNELVIEYGKSYRLEVTAVIDGKTLTAKSTTTVPGMGLKVDNNNLGTMQYREKDNNGELKKFNVSFVPAQQAVFHAYSINAINPLMDNFIYDNAYFSDIDTTELREDFPRYAKQYGWLQDSKPGAEKLNFDVEWHEIWFYDDYKLVLYAADENFKDYLITHNDVQEMDGNFHEPKFHIEGEGIGIFGSAVTDTIYFKIVK